MADALVTATGLLATVTPPVMVMAPTECRALFESILPALDCSALQSVPVDEICSCSKYSLHICQMSKLGHLEYLHLNDRGCRGQIPPAIASLSYLKMLDITGNALTGSIPATLGSMQHLQALYVSKNRFSGPVPTELSKLKNLIYLAMDNNELIETIDFLTLNEMPTLEEVHLSNNKFSGDIPSAISKLSSLVKLQLSDNNLSGHLPSEISMLKYLRILSLSSNYLIGRIPSEYARLPRIQVLQVDGNFMDEEVPSEIMDLLKARNAINRYGPLHLAISPQMQNVESTILKDKSDTDCSICFENLKVGEEIVKGENCVHSNHHRCIIHWIRKGKSSCPMCRENLFRQ